MVDNSSEQCTIPATLTSTLPPLLTLATASLTILLLTASLSTSLTGHPRSQLGRRPPGYNVWNYLTGQMTRGEGGVWGYDTSLGANAPLLRVLYHTGTYLMVWPLLTLVTVLISGGGGGGGTGEGEADGGSGGGGYCSGTELPLTILSPSILSDGIIAAAVYFGGTYLYHAVSPGVSHPGGPREHKIRRMPEWEDRTTTLDLASNDDDDDDADADQADEKEGAVEWRCAVAQDSHGVTLGRFGLSPSDGGGDGDNDEGDGDGDGDGNAGGTDGAAGGEGGNGETGVQIGLTGEPYGRQMWTWSKKKGSSSAKAKDSKGGGGGLTRQLSQLLGGSINKKQQQAQQVVVDEELVEEMASGGRPKGFNPSVNPNSCDKIFRAQQIRSYLATGAQPPSRSTDDPQTQTTTADAARRGAHFYSMLQTSDGHWAGDYGGPHFLLPGLVVAWYVMGQPESMLDAEQRRLMSQYLRVHQQKDGGWGTHIESPSTMFGAVVSYLALRLLGAEATDEVCVRGRDFIKENGGATMTSSWAKFWLCLVGCMDWEGHNSVPPEMWLLPNWFPFHPGRLWCHCRMVYLPMGYLYGSRFVYSKAETDPLIAALRKELYCEPYESIPWSKTRHLVAPMDNYSPIPLFMKVAQDFLALYESWSIFRPFRDRVRKAGLEYCVEYMAAEDLQTNFIDIGPVNKALNLVSAYHFADGDVKATTVQNHMMRIPDYLWVAEDGMKMQGYNGSQCWDTSFAIQALSECKLLDEFPSVSSKVWSYLERTQILSTETSKASPAYAYESAANRDKFYRHVSEGGWPFSTSAHGWPISDCTGEGLKGVLALLRCKTVADGIHDGSLKPIEEKRLHDAVNVITTLQNEDGGWATYENNRGFGWYEQLNPSEVFGDIMIDYSYVECSMASLTALAEFHELYPSHRTEEIEHCIQRGREFMKSIQREDGSWYGSWACCFCYGCWFGIEGLVMAGELPSSPVIQRCCDFLLSHQRPNGGWGEDFTSCYDKDYAENGMDSYGDNGSGVVNTAWALLALSAAKCDNVEAIRRGVKYLIQRQLPCGDWPQEGIAGVFNRACGITYTAYRNVFPIWALGRCAATYGDALDITEEQ